MPKQATRGAQAPGKMSSPPKGQRAAVSKPSIPKKTGTGPGEQAR